MPSAAYHRMTAADRALNRAEATRDPDEIARRVDDLEASIAEYREDSGSRRRPDEKKGARS
jgi:hypothetical protein